MNDDDPGYFRGSSWWTRVVNDRKLAETAETTLTTTIRNGHSPHVEVSGGADEKKIHNIIKRTYIYIFLYTARMPQALHSMNIHTNIYMYTHILFIPPRWTCRKRQVTCFFLSCLPFRLKNAFAPDGDVGSSFEGQREPPFLQWNPLAVVSSDCS